MVEQNLTVSHAEALQIIAALRVYKNVRLIDDPEALAAKKLSDKLQKQMDNNLEALMNKLDEEIEMRKIN